MLQYPVTQTSKALIQTKVYIVLGDNPPTDEVDDAIKDLFVQPQLLDVSQDDLVVALGTVPSSIVCGGKVNESLFAT